MCCCEKDKILYNYQANLRKNRREQIKKEHRRKETIVGTDRTERRTDKEQLDQKIEQKKIIKAMYYFLNSRIKKTQVKNCKNHKPRGVAQFCK